MRRWSQEGAGAARSGGASDDRPATPFEDPLSALPDTARRLLLAAKHVVVTHGFDALTLSAVASEAGENTALIAYYFGNKAGLVEAMLDSVIHDEYVASQDRMSGVGSSELSERLVDEMRALDEAYEDFRVFFELLPHAMGDDALRLRMARLYDWYRSEKLGWLGFDDPSRALEDAELRGFAQLLSAVLDGLAIQAIVDPGLDLGAPYDVLRRLFSGTSLATFLEEARARRGAPSAE
ncbi:MAG TPA: TetR/AcrR family transcriptional regulator [Thermoleophilia bacterium]|nr:TetR/AcrR family transcriptional regulator [Thermoleophilia bacterium]